MSPGGGEQLVDVGRGITLCYETFGERSDPPLLLVQGLGMQLIAWPDALCESFAARGLCVIRYDNRDIGRSTWLKSIPPPTPRQLLTRRFDPSQYTLTDMAQDAAGLLDALELAPAHVVGVSMGGMIGQTLAAQHPESVRSLVSIMSSTGARFRGLPAPSTLRMLLSPPPRTREESLARALTIFGHIGSLGFATDEDYVRELAGRAFDRGFNPAGTGRQLAGIIKSGDRTKELGRITAPTLVLHGDRDRMVHPSGGRATAAAIPGARFETVTGLGHDLPTGFWPLLVSGVAEHIAKSETTKAAAR